MATRERSAPRIAMSQSEPSIPERPLLRATPRAGLLSALPSTISSEAEASRRVRYRAGYLGLLLLCLFAFFWRLGSVPLFDMDEALYVTCARQMVLTGDLVTPRLNSRPLRRPTETSVPFFEKPILVYWCCAASMRLFGLSAGAARLPVACAALLATGAIVLAGTRWFGPRAGLLAGLVYALAPMTIADARQMTTDGLLTLWFLVAMLAFWGCRRAEPEGRRCFSIYPLLFWTMCALAVLTKGAIGLVLPLLVLGLFVLLERLTLRLRLRRRKGTLLLQWQVDRPDRERRSLAVLRPLPGLLLFLALAAPWHYLVWKAGGVDAEGRTFLQEYVLRQHIGRFRGLDEVHNAPLPTYLVYFLLGFFPWACFVPAAFCFGSEKTGMNHRDTETQRKNRGRVTQRPTPNAQDREEGRGKREQSSPSAAQRPGDAEARRFLLVWFWTIFGFFSLGAAKLPTYIVPAYPAAALLVGRWLDRTLAAESTDEIRRSTRAYCGGALGAAITTALLVAAVLAMPHLLPARAAVPTSVSTLALHATLPLLIGSGFAWLCFRFGGPTPCLRWAGWVALSAIPLVLVGIVCTEGYRVIARDVLGPYQQLAIAARPDATAGLPVVYYHIIPRRPSMLTYGRYAPLERKDTPLLPFVRPFLTSAHPQADVITSRRTFQEELTGELAAAPDVSARVLAATGNPANGWMLLRIRAGTQ
jgi:4-amino-4-deoxy-L-arabinose transferase-like glycosyltransferase